jgi:hypothetical protein
MDSRQKGAKMDEIEEILRNDSVRGSLPFRPDFAAAIRILAARIEAISQAPAIATDISHFAPISPPDSPADK